MPKHIQNKELLKKIIVCLKEIRNSKNITLEVFYFDTGVHLARIEQGEQNITISTLSRICDYYKINLSEFFLMVENK